MVIVEPTEHFKNTTTQRKKNNKKPEKISLNIPRYLDQWVQENTTYKEVIKKTKDTQETPIAFKFFKLTKADYTWLVQKAKQLEMPRTTILRYLIENYYEQYINKDHRNAPELQTQFTQKILISEHILNQIEDEEGLAMEQLAHYCIRQYSASDEQYLQRYYDRVYINMSVTKTDHTLLKTTSKNINQRVIDTIREMSCDASLH